VTVATFLISWIGHVMTGFTLGVAFVGELRGSYVSVRVTATSVKDV